MLFKTQLLSVALATCIGVTGCASSSMNSSSNLKQDEPSFFSTSGATACAVTAGIVGVLCALSQRDADKCLAAAAAGCGVGMAINYGLDKYRADCHNLEDQLEQSIEKIQESYKSTDSLKKNALENLAQDKQDIASIKKGIHDGTNSISDMNAKIAEMEDNLKYIQSRIEVDQKNIENQNKQLDTIKAGKGLPADNQEVANQKEQELTQEMANVQSNIDDLVNLASEYSSEIVMARKEASSFAAG